MRRAWLKLTTSLFLTLAAPLAAIPAQAAAPAALRLWRLDCGRIQMNDASPLSDTSAYAGQTRRLSNGCYLVQHGDDYLLWDAGLPRALLDKPLNNQPISATLDRDLESQLAAIGVRPEQISRLAISHYHFDHVGQAALFPRATLLIGAADLAALRAGSPPFADPSLLAPWLTGDGVTDPVQGDRDVFGDGSVTILAAPGHTPGEQALLVRLPQTGAVILSGDVAHLEAQLAPRRVPTWNTDRAGSLASIDRLAQLAAALKARIIVQHDPEDVPRLARFPEASR
ncbi:N-acyl homoserine lactonase family protein [Caulobacter hibisci]|uniref:N-acyl homoserine lactonase family protein n=1 Tax=Caulobacter hibisci TaxID=2035993 RepID=A0ABS0T583_9CAUL|nr:N-acyl homoserine lactonase family protein [Caulobacter hibisci]MBI1686017.1 N-acyl homoserine lactonase family protein [Caulobacter hibisci]